MGDVDGDGFEDAFVSSLNGAHPDIGIRSGELWFYRGTAAGLPNVGERVPAWRGFSQWDHLRGVKGIGDFNGDGHPDFAVLVGHDERDANVHEDFAIPDPCVARQGISNK